MVLIKYILICFLDRVGEPWTAEDADLPPGFDLLKKLAHSCQLMFARLCLEEVTMGQFTISGALGWMCRIYREKKSILLQRLKAAPSRKRQRMNDASVDLQPSQKRPRITSPSAPSASPAAEVPHLLAEVPLLVSDSAFTSCSHSCAGPCRPAQEGVRHD